MTNEGNNRDQHTEPTEKKKVSLQELMKQQLERKKQAQTGGTQTINDTGKNQRMKSQQTKKASNTRRKMGS